MASTYWIKLYHEVLNDPKMGRLPDRLWRRVVECFLLAGEAGDDGYLPAVADMAWTLRCSPDELQVELEEVSRLSDILEWVDGRWFVVKFSDRQAAVPAAERKARQRERDKRGAYYADGESQPVTTDVTNRDIEKRRIEKSESEIRAESELSRDPPAPWSVEWDQSDERDVVAYHKRLSGCTLNKAQQALLLSGVEGLGASKVCKAVRDWLTRGHKPYNVEGILDVARNGWKDSSRASPKVKAQVLDGEAYLNGPYADIIKH